MERNATGECKRTLMLTVCLVYAFFFQKIRLGKLIHIMLVKKCTSSCDSQ